MIKGISPSIATVEMVKGDFAPRYDETKFKELGIKRFVITEQGTEKNLPIVDIVMVDNDGKEYFTMITGRIISAVAAAIRGANMRNHGREDV